MKREALLAWVAIFCLISGALLSLFASLPYGASLAQERGYIGPCAVAVAYVLWLAETKPSDLFFGVVVGGSLALIAKDKLLLGIAGVALICMARIIQRRVEEKCS